MGCGIEGGNGLGRNGRHLGEGVLAVGRIADQCTSNWGASLHPAAATILYGHLSVSVIPGGRRPQVRITWDVGGWGMTF